MVKSSTATGVQVCSGPNQLCFEQRGENQYLFPLRRIHQTATRGPCATKLMDDLRASVNALLQDTVKIKSWWKSELNGGPCETCAKARRPAACRQSAKSVRCVPCVKKRKTCPATRAYLVYYLVRDRICNKKKALEFLDAHKGRSSNPGRRPKTKVTRAPSRSSSISPPPSSDEEDHGPSGPDHPNPAPEEHSSLSPATPTGTTRNSTPDEAPAPAPAPTEDGRGDSLKKVQNYIEDLQKRFAYSQQENQALRQNINELYFQKTGLWKENESLGGEVRSLRLDFDSVKEETQRLLLEREVWRREKATLLQDAESLRESATQQGTDPRRPPETDDAKKVIEEQRQELDRLRREASEFRHKNEDLLRENESQKKLTQALSENFRQQHAQALDQFTSHLLSTSEALREERTRMAALSKEYEKTTRALESVEAERNMATSSSAHTPAAISALETRLAKQEKRFTTLIGRDSPIRRKFEEVVYAVVDFEDRAKFVTTSLGASGRDLCRLDGRLIAGRDSPGVNEHIVSVLNEISAECRKLWLKCADDVKEVTGKDNMFDYHQRGNLATKDELEADHKKKMEEIDSFLLSLANSDEHDEMEVESEEEEP